MAGTAVALRGAPTTEIGTTLPNALPSWAAYGRADAGTPVTFNDLEYVPELRWPQSVRVTFPRMATDSQIKALERGTFLPITNYAWGIDPNGAPPAMVEAACNVFNLLKIDDARVALETGKSPEPIGRTHNRFVFKRHLAQLLKALRYGHYPFEQVGEVRMDGRRWGAAQDEFWHLTKLAPRPPRSLTDIRAGNDGELLFVVQRTRGFATLMGEPLDANRLVYYVWDPEEDPGDWLGTSMYRACYREWLLKDRLLRIDVANQESAGGRIIPTTPANATPTEKTAIAAAAGAASQTVSGAQTAFPDGTGLTVLRGGSGEAIASVNRHDEAMSRAWMLMLIQLASTAHGSRAVGDNFQSLLGIFQEGIAQWACDTFNEHVIEDWADWNYGPDTEYVPRLAFVRPDELDPAGKMGKEDLAVANDDPAVQEAVKAAIADIREKRRSSRLAAVPAANVTVTKFRREPFDHEIRAAVDFAQIDDNWKSQVEQLVAEWGSVKSSQIEQLKQLIESAGGNLATLTQIAALEAGADTIEARLVAMAHLGVSEALAEAERQGATAVAPDLSEVEAEMTARADAVARMLAQSLSFAGRNKAIQLTGPAVSPESVAAQVSDYLSGLSDSYLTDQFSGALSAAQNGGRLAAMQENKPQFLYASELLDSSCCPACEEIDGKEYATAEEAAMDYPAGFKDCAGGPRCRGSVVAVYDEAAPS